MKCVPASKNIVKKTTESKYVVVSPWSSEDRDCDAANANNAMDAKYATETPDETLIHERH